MSLEKEEKIMKLIANFKKRTYEILEVADSKDTTSRICDLVLLTLIVVNVLFSILETVEELSLAYYQVFSFVEEISVIVFSLEYVLRIWTITLRSEFKKPFIGRLKYSFTFLSIVDLVAIAPYYLPMIIDVDLRFVRVLRLTRVFRLLKLERYTNSLEIISEAIRVKKSEISITFFLLSLTILISASILYVLEVSVQPEKFTSIPYSIWWSVSAITSVGYGDVYPITPLGRLFGSITALCGVGLIALPVAIFTSGFNEVLQKNTKIKCPHCNNEINVEK